MRLFVSYARVDKPFCKQIVRTLDAHEIWYDQRLHAGQKWWDEILKRLEWCEGFLYLLSPDSASSEYCQKEFVLAKDAGKHIFPVLIQARTEIPENLRAYQSIDLTDGLNTKAVKELLNAIYIAEKERTSTRQKRQAPARLIRSPVPAETIDPTKVINEVAEALETGAFDRAVFLLKRSKESGFESRFIDLEAVLHEAEEALEQQAYLREAEREYAPIVALIKHERTRHLGCQAFLAFHKDFPGYDPQNLIAHCGVSRLPTIEWCVIPAGKVKVERVNGAETHNLPTFQISKYPITNDQYQTFIDAREGYQDERWWNHSQAAREWRREHPDPLTTPEGQGNYPRINVCWHEAVAFCRWLSFQIGLTITLPTEQQWQRAAQGDDERAYPWGVKFDPALCNTYESRIRHTTPVNRYPSGASPHGVWDMIGNAWEWCLNAQDGALDMNSRAERAVRGGSFISTKDRARTLSNFHLNPLCRYDTIGFRIVCN